MNEREHIALTEAQIIAAEKGELKLEYRSGEKVHQVVWMKPPYTQTYMPVMSLNAHGYILNHSLNGVCSNYSSYDLFVSEPTVKQEQTEPRPLYEVGEIIQVSDSINFDSFVDNAFFAFFGGYVLTKRDTDKTPSCWLYHRKKKKIVMLEGKVMEINEAIEYLKNLQ